MAASASNRGKLNRDAALKEKNPSLGESTSSVECGVPHLLSTLLSAILTCNTDYSLRQISNLTEDNPECCH
ncbi:5844_t:CDS:2, partial [Acaulospora colombiana]